MPFDLSEPSTPHLPYSPRWNIWVVHLASTGNVPSVHASVCAVWSDGVVSWRLTWVPLSSSCHVTDRQPSDLSGSRWSQRLHGSVSTAALTFKPLLSFNLVSKHSANKHFYCSHWVFFLGQLEAEILPLRPEQLLKLHFD